MIVGIGETRIGATEQMEIDLTVRHPMRGSWETVMKRCSMHMVDLLYHSTQICPLLQFWCLYLVPGWLLFYFSSIYTIKSFIEVCWCSYNLYLFRPLGPFVPAPPEVAMQMFRDQGPSSYDPSGMTMRSGPHIGGQASMIAVPPTFRPDPRRMRRYLFC